MGTIRIERTDSDNADFGLLIAELDNDLNNRYGKKQSEYDECNKIDFLDTVVIAKDGESAIGCACFKPFDGDSVELKRMYVKPSARGTGISNFMIKELEDWARENGFSTVVLETGKRQPEAVRFYLKNGYEIRPNYGQYAGNENSICMTKKIII